MRSISIRQPWAGLIAAGRKTIELRSWYTHHRGPLLVCAGSSLDRDAARLHGPGGPRGVTVCVVDVVDVRPTRPEDAEAACCEFGPAECERLYSWVLARPRLVVPAPLKGRLGLFEGPEPCYLDSVPMLARGGPAP